MSKKSLVLRNLGLLLIPLLLGNFGGLRLRTKTYKTLQLKILMYEPDAWRLPICPPPMITDVSVIDQQFNPINSPNAYFGLVSVNDGQSEIFTGAIGIGNLPKVGSYYQVTIPKNYTRWCRISTTIYEPSSNGCDRMPWRVEYIFNPIDMYDMQAITIFLKEINRNQPNANYLKRNC